MDDKLKQLADALARAQAAATELDAIDDQLSALIPEYEHALKGLRLGVAISVVIETGEGGSKILSFDKYAGAWHLLIEDGPDDGDPDNWTQTPLASASRDERANVFAWHFDTLITSAAQQIEKKIESRKSTLTDAKQRLTAIKSLAGLKP